IQDPGARLRASAGHGFHLSRPHARRHIGRARLARHRVRGGGPVNAPAVPKARIKVYECLAWSERQRDDRYELVDGEIVATRRDSVRHNQTKFAAARALQDATRAGGPPCVVFIDGVGVKINDKTLRIPDVLVQCGAEPDPDALIVGSPLIVVEVVSPSSEDIETKLLDYFAVASIRMRGVLSADCRPQRLLGA